MATQPSLRIGDRERDAVAAELREHYAHGRLTLDEFNQRLDGVFGAKTQADLSRITADLPHIRSGGSPLPSSGTGRSASLATGPSPSGWATDRNGWPVRASAAAAGADAGLSRSTWSAATWSGNGWSDNGWSGRHHHRRGGFAPFVTLLAALASWLLVFDVFQPALHFPWPGRVGMLIAIYTIIRGLLRRIFRFPRR